MMEFDVFGRRVLVRRIAGGWRAMYPGSDGKHRVAEDIVIPPEVDEGELEGYLTDLCHEWGGRGRSEVRRIR